MKKELESLNEVDKTYLKNIYDLWAKRKKNEAEHAQIKAEIAILNANLVKQGKIDLVSFTGSGRCW